MRHKTCNPMALDITDFKPGMRRLCAKFECVQTQKCKTYNEYLNCFVCFFTQSV